MIVDESSVMKNMKSQITNEILEMIDIIPHRYVLSGCPTPNHNSEIFPQMKFVDSMVFGNIYYSLSFSYEDFKQSQDRIHRKNKRHAICHVKRVRYSGDIKG